MKKITELIDNGEQMSLNNNEIDILINSKLIYPCEECHCFHLEIGTTFNEIDLVLNLNKES